jgi:hypothetical protein
MRLKIKVVAIISSLLLSVSIAGSVFNYLVAPEKPINPLN